MGKCTIQLPPPSGFFSNYYPHYYYKLNKPSFSQTTGRDSHHPAQPCYTALRCALPSEVPHRTSGQRVHGVRVAPPSRLARPEPAPSPAPEQMSGTRAQFLSPIRRKYGSMCSDGSGSGIVSLSTTDTVDVSHQRRFWGD